MRSISSSILLFLTGAFVLTACPSDDSEGGTDAADDTSGDATTASSTNPATTDPATTDPATTDPATTDPATTDPATTDPATTDPSTTQTTDPTTDDLDTSGSADTGVGECTPTGVPCDDCLIVDNCCAESLACAASEGCDCVVVCMMAGGSGEACGAECGLDAPPPELNALFGCFETASCGDVCM